MAFKQLLYKGKAFELVKIGKYLI